MRLLVTFYSVSSALMLEAALKDRGLPCILIPTPRKLGSSCGYAAEVEGEDIESLVRLLRGIQAEWEAVWRRNGNTYEAPRQNE